MAGWAARRVPSGCARRPHPVLRRARRRGRHRLHGRRPPGHRRAHRALAGRLADRRSASRTGGRRHQGRPVRTRAAPDPAGGRAGAVPHPAPRHPGHGPARGPPPGRDRLRPGGGHGGVPGRRLRPHPARELVAGRHRGGRGGRQGHRRRAARIAPACPGNAATSRGATVIRRSRSPRAAPETVAMATPGCRRRPVWAPPRCIRRWRGGDGAPRRRRASPSNLPGARGHRP